MTDKAGVFHALHKGPSLLILPNAWDAVSARVLESLGAPAVATSSAAVAWSHGYRDGHNLPVPLLLTTVKEIARVVRVPVTADVEGGYSDDPEVVGENVSAVIEAGAIGINLEDGTGSPDVLCAKIDAVRRRARQRGVELFINARVDVFLRSLAEGKAAIVETLSRARRYTEAGADGIFTPGVTDSKVLAELTAGISLPVNVLAQAGLPDRDQLLRLGVRRLSAGAGLARAALTGLRSATESFLATGSADALSRAAGPPVNYNALLDLE